MTTVLTGIYKNGFIETQAGATVSITPSCYITNSSSSSNSSAFYSRVATSVINSGTIKGQWVNKFGTPASRGIGLAGPDEYLENFGSISGAYFGVYFLSGGTVINYGGISGNAGVQINGVPPAGGSISPGGTIINLGIITGGVSILGNGNVQAVGSIANGDAANPSARIAGSVLFPTLTNFGTIEGEISGKIMTANGSPDDTSALVEGPAYIGFYTANPFAGVPVTMTNFGTFGGELEIRNGGDITNGSPTDLTAATGQFTGLSVNGHSPTTLTNYGTMAGADFEAGGRLVNGDLSHTLALISGGVSAVGPNYTIAISNFGTIGNPAGQKPPVLNAVDIRSQGGMVNGSETDRTAIIIATGFRSGVGLYGTASATNFGTIAGQNGPYGFGAYLSGDCLITNGASDDVNAFIGDGCGILLEGGSTAVNFGSIVGLGGTGVQLKSKADLLVMEGGSTVSGSVIAGNGTLEAPSGTATVTGGITSTITGAGTLLMSGGASVLASGGQLSVSRLVFVGSSTTVAVSKSLIFTGQWSQSGATLTIGSGSIFTLKGAGDTFYGAVRGAGTLALAGGSATFGAGASLSVAAITVSLPTTTMAVDSSLAYSGQWSQLGGTVTLGVSDSLTLKGGNDSFAAIVAGGGTLAFASGTATFQAGARLTVAKVSVSGATTHLSVTEDLSFTGAWQQSAGTLTIGSGDTLTLTSGDDSLAGTVAGAGTLHMANAAVSISPGSALPVSHIAVTGVGGLVTMNTNLVYAGTWSQTGGTLSVSGGDTLTFKGGANAFSGAITGAGSVVFSGGADIFQSLTLSAGATRIASADVALAGTIILPGLISATTPNLTVGAGAITSASLAGGGILRLSNVTTNRIIGATSAAALQNVDDTIDGAGELGGGQLKLINQNGGNIIGDDANALIIDTGANTIINSGLIEATGAGGVTINSAVQNTGTLAAMDGALTLNAPVTGGGVVLIRAATASFAAAFSENAAFDGSGQLSLAQSVLYRGVITGFSRTGATSLDLQDILFGSSTTVRFSGSTTSGTLTVTDGTHTAKIVLAGNYTAATFAIAGDGHGGTTVTDPTNPPAPLSAPLAQAMAAFQTAPAPAVASAHHHRMPQLLPLACRNRN